MRISLRSTSPESFLMSRRVELLPQSSAATTSVTYVVQRDDWHVDARRDQLTHGVIGTRQEIREVRVKALHPHTRATHAANGGEQVGAHDGGVASTSVVVVRALEFLSVNQVFEAVHTTFTFQSTHGITQFSVHQPKQCWHGRAVTKVWLIFNDHGSSINSTHDDRASTGEWTAEKFFYRDEVIG
jgi:hypothetical protein